MATASMIGQTRAKSRSGRRDYFAVTSLILMALTLVAFGDNLFTDVGQPSNSDPKFIVHGLISGAWVIMLVVQSWLVRAGNVALHRRLGITGFAIAVGVTLSTIWVFIAVWKGWAAMTPEVRANRLLLPSFALFVAYAYAQRRRPDWHKRLIFVGTFFMLEPVLARCYDPLLVPLMRGMTTTQVDDAFLPVLFAAWLAFFVSLIVHDLLTLRHIHRVSAVALLWFGGVWGLVAIS